MVDDVKPVARLVELPPGTQTFLAGLRDDEITKVKFLVEELTLEDLKVLHGGVETLRVARRMGTFGMYILGVVTAGASAAAAIKLWFVTGGPPR